MDVEHCHMLVWTSHSTLKKKPVGCGQRGRGGGGGEGGRLRTYFSTVTPNTRTLKEHRVSISHLRKKQKKTFSPTASILWTHRPLSDSLITLTIVLPIFGCLSGFLPYLLTPFLPSFLIPSLPRTNHSFAFYHFPHWHRLRPSI